MPVSRNLRVWSIAIICVLICAGTLPRAASAPASDVKLTILYTNDVHGHLFPFDYGDLGRHLTDVGGAARRAALIRKLKAEARNPVLVMDAGDVFQRGPLSDLKGAPDIAVMNAVPYDVMTLGNNEFKAAPGPEALSILKERLREVTFPVVSANVFETKTTKRLVAPYKIFEVAGVRVAILGLLTPDDSKLAGFSGLRIDDPIVTARLMIPELRRQADYVIALTHIGIAKDLELASSVTGIDVVIGGHSHTWVFRPLLVRARGAAQPGTVGGTIVCQDGEWGATVGRLDLTLHPAGDHGYVTSAYSGRLVDIDSSIGPAPDIEAIVEKSAGPYRTPVCKLTAAIATSTVADWVAARMREAASSQVAVEPLGEVEQGLKAGNVTALDVRSMFPFTNQVDKITITGSQLRAFLAAQPDCALSGAVLTDGEVLVDGRKVSDAQTYTLAVEDEFAQHSPALVASPSVRLGRTTADIVMQYLFFHYPRN